MNSNEAPAPAPEDPAARVDQAWAENEQAILVVLRKYLSEQDARDAAHDTYVRLRDFVRGAETIRNLAGFAFTTAKNIALQQLRDGATQRRLDDQFVSEQEMVDQRSPARIYESAQELDALIDQFDRRPLRERLAFEANVFDEPAESIGERLGVSPRSVQRLVGQARDRLATVRRHLRGERDNE